MHTGPVEIEAGVGQYGYYNADLIAEALNTNSSLKNTNLVNRNADGDVVGFQSNFNLTNLTLGVTLKNAVHGMPLRFFTDYVYNWGAATDDRQGVTAGLKLGQTKQRRDWAATAYYEYLGQEAAVSEFTASDFGLGGTANQGPVIQLDYQLLDPITITVRNYFVNFTDPPANTNNPTLFRLQLDAMAKF
jgi:hypothetical protein